LLGNVESNQTAPENPLDLLVQECLQGIGITGLCDWDVLVFLYRHPISLARVEQIARFVGCTSKAVGDTLDILESRGLIKRSRESQDVRMYQLVYSEALLAPKSCFRQLLTLTENRSGRLLLAQKLRRQRVGPQLVGEGSANG
jgi:DNA-binding MarR family transcriptional regulator